MVRSFSLLFLLLVITQVLSFSIGRPPTCNYPNYDTTDFGCTSYHTRPDGSINQLNCTESTPGHMHWAYRPVRTSAYAIRTSDDSNTANDPTEYQPGQITELHVRVHEYERRFRGIMIWAEDSTGAKVGEWAFAQGETLYFAPWDDAQCSPVAMHQSARIKPFHSILKWRAPDTAVGTVTFKSLFKWGDANTGAFFLPETDLQLNPGTAVAQNIFKSESGQSCDATCANVGGTCTVALFPTDFQSFETDVLPHYSCHYPLMAGCMDHDPSADIYDHCQVRSNCGAQSPSCSAVSTGQYDSFRFCACEPDPCNPNPCTSVDTMATCAPDTTVSPLTEEAFICTCSADWTGATCTEAVVQNPCLNNPSPCQNGGTCNSLGNGLFSCDCPTCHFGDTCDITPPCTPGVCGEGSCAEVEIGNPATSCDTACTCNPGWLLDSNGNCTEADGCMLGTPCANGAACTDIVNGGDVESKFCDCSGTPGFTGPFCNTPTDECLTLPCQNGTCIDQFLNYTCECEDGCYGRNCDCCGDTCVPCAPGINRCQNGATCTEDDTVPAGYTCGPCPAGFLGYDCDVVDPCFDNPCQGAGTCVNGANPGDFSCLCTECRLGTFCEIEPPCQAAATPICNGHGTCSNDLPTVLGQPCEPSCSACHAGWSGDFCEEGDACALNNAATCLNNGVCVDIPAGADLTRYQCNCPAGYAGDRCETVVDLCTPVNPCLNGGTCTPAPNSYTCECPAMPEGEICVGSRCDCCGTVAECGNPCDYDPCDLANPTGHGAIACVENNTAAGGFHCTCNDFYTGERCRTEINECERLQANGVQPCAGPDPSGQPRGTPVNGGPGVCTCQCNNGWTGSDCSEDLNECASNEGGDPANHCLNGGNCYESDFGPGHYCVCPGGFCGVHCETPCGCTCNDGTDCPVGEDGVTPDSCLCNGGNFRLPDGTCPVCISDNTDGTFNPIATCKNGGQCTGLPGSLECCCPPGYWGGSCEFECTCGDCETCTAGGTCVPTSTDLWRDPECTSIMATLDQTYTADNNPSTCDCTANPDAPGCNIEMSESCLCNGRERDEDLPCPYPPYDVCQCEFPYTGSNCDSVQPAAVAHCAFDEDCATYGDDVSCSLIGDSYVCDMIPCEIDEHCPANEECNVVRTDVQPGGRCQAKRPPPPPNQNDDESGAPFLQCALAFLLVLA